MRKITIEQFLTKEQIQKAIDLKKAKDICREIIEPNLSEINRKIGQENDAMYLSYMVEYIVSLLGD
jgi:hypothetical protein